MQVVLKIKENVNTLGIFSLVLSYLMITLSTAGAGTTGGSMQILVFILFFGIFLYFLKPSLSFVFFLIPIIEPTGSLKYVSVQILFLLLSFTSVIHKFPTYLKLIKSDYYLKRMLLASFLFMLYQFIAFMDGGGGVIKNILSNLRQIFGIWLIIPAYYFVITDRKNFFLSILFISLLTYIFYYISYLKIYQIIDIVEANRGMDSDIVRAKTRDFCYIIKIIGYFLPVLFLVRFKPANIRLLMLLISFLAYGVLFTALLRLDTAYTFLGGILCFIFIKKKYGIKLKVSNLLGITFSLLVIVIVFNEQFSNVFNTFSGTFQAMSGNTDDSSMTFRKEFELPILVTYILANPIFGIGNNAVILESFIKYDFWANDLALLGAIAIYGVFGISIYLIRFFVLFRSIKFNTISKQIYENYKIETILYYGLVAFFIAQLFFKVYLTFAELLSNETYAEFGVLFGVYFGLRKFLEIKALEYNEIK